MKLLGINAFIRAAHLSNNAKVFEVLAKKISDVSKQISILASKSSIAVNQSSIKIDGLLETAREINPDNVKTMHKIK
ncbi:MAG: hypothetical protein PHE54_03560 [Bacilli bacterium]|nr:hypothetical protein [Bacilli bacterium]